MATMSGIVLKDISSSDLKILKSTPAVLFRMLSESEFDILQVLLVSKHGLTGKGIQKEIAKRRLKNNSELWADKSEETKLPTANLGRAALPDEFTRHLSRISEYLNGLTVEKALRIARKFGIEIPSDATIGRTLDRLVENGYIGQRKLEGERANALFFLNPEMSNFLKEDVLYTTSTTPRPPQSMRYNPDAFDKK